MVSGHRFLVSLMVFAHCAAPLSGRSSRSTDVITACFRFIALTALAIFMGSCSSGGNGCPVCVAQNRHARVQRSPKIMKVAVPFFQQCPLFGHCPLVQMVCNPPCSIVDSTKPYLSPPSIFV